MPGHACRFWSPLASFGRLWPPLPALYRRLYPPSTTWSPAGVAQVTALGVSPGTPTPHQHLWSPARAAQPALVPRKILLRSPMTLRHPTHSHPTCPAPIPAADPGRGRRQPPRDRGRRRGVSLLRLPSKRFRMLVKSLPSFPRLQYTNRWWGRRGVWRGNCLKRWGKLVLKIRDSGLPVSGFALRTSRPGLGLPVQALSPSCPTAPS